MKRTLSRRKLLGVVAAGAVAAIVPLQSVRSGDCAICVVDDSDVDRWLAESPPDWPADLARVLAQAERLGYEHENPEGWRDALYAGGIPLRPGVAVVYGLNGRQPSPPEAVGMANAIEAAGFSILATGYSDDRRGWAHVVRGDNDAVRQALDGYWLADDEVWPVKRKGRKD